MKSIIKLFEAGIGDNAISSVAELLHDGSIATGKYIDEFERNFGDVIKGDKIVTVSNMTAAIEIALRIIGFNDGDEIIASPFSCMSSTSPIGYMGLNVKWLDYKRNNFNISVEDVERLITSKTKAILIYYVAGYVFDIHSIAELCRSKNIYLIEDCNNAHFSQVNSHYVGREGDFAIYSFYPNRIVNSIEGGALRVKKEKHYNEALKMRRYGIDMYKFRCKDGEINPEYDITVTSNNFSMNNVAAAIANHQLNDCRSRIKLIKSNCKYFMSNIKNNSLKTIDFNNNIENCNWVFFVRTKQQRKLLAYLK
ncbi:TPA: DegT/DnrJ/EryC1/StrS family aminotransferase, partial [Escherichia coli]